MVRATVLEDQQEALRRQSYDNASVWKSLNFRARKMNEL